MDKNDEIISKIYEDISSLEQAIYDSENRIPEKVKCAIYQDIGNAYDAYIPNFGMGLYDFIPDSHFYDEVSGDSLQHNLRTLVAKLRAFIAFGNIESLSIKQNTSPIMIQNNPSFQNINTTKNEMTFNVSFEYARSAIEDMPGLTAPETDEIISKINEIKVLVEAPEPKKRKWEKAKPIIKWIADKSVDVGMVLLPLLLKTQQ